MSASTKRPMYRNYTSGKGPFRSICTLTNGLACRSPSVLAISRCILACACAIIAGVVNVAMRPRAFTCVIAPTPCRHIRSNTLKH